MPDTEVRSQRVTLFLASQQHASLQEMCRQKGISLQEQVRTLLNEELERWGHVKWTSGIKTEKAEVNHGIPGRPTQPIIVKKGHFALEQMESIYAEKKQRCSPEEFEEWYGRHCRMFDEAASKKDWALLVRMYDLSIWNVKKWKDRQAELEDFLAGNGEVPSTFGV